MSRPIARIAAMQMIFEKLSGGQGGEDTLRMVYDQLREEPPDQKKTIQENEPDEEDRQYITATLEGVLEHLDEIDDLLGKTARGWTVERMSQVDLTILRLAVYEILMNNQVPDNVAVAEALELTERYSDPDDKAFVNGILGTIVRGKASRE